MIFFRDSEEDKIEDFKLQTHHTWEHSQDLTTYDDTTTLNIWEQYTQWHNTPEICLFKYVSNLEKFCN